MAKKNRSLNYRMQQVIKTLTELGGCAQPHTIYKAMDCSSWGTKTPQATIRQKLQLARDMGLIVQGEDHYWYTIAYAKQLKHISSQVEKQLQSIEQKVDGMNRHETILKISDGKVIIEQCPDEQVHTDIVKTPIQQPQGQSHTELSREQQIEAWVTKSSCRQAVARMLEDYLAGKEGKDATIVIQSATKAGAIKRPSYQQFNSLFPNVISRNKYYDYTDPSYRGYDKDYFNNLHNSFEAVIDN